MKHYVNHREPADTALADHSAGVGTLRLAGFGYLVGDAALFGAGVMEKNMKASSAGLLWALGGLAAARYGNPSAEKQLELLSRRFGEYLKKQHIEIDGNPTTKNLTQPGGVIDHLESFLYSYPSQALNAVYALGSLQLLASGVTHRFTPDIASGVLIGAGALAGLLIPEKKSDPEYPPEGVVQKTIAWAQEKPLRVSGALFTINNTAMIWAAMAKRKENPAQKSYMLRFVTAASYVFSNIMLSLSSKDYGENSTHDILSGIADVAAHVIAAQDPRAQRMLVQHIAGYLAAQPEIRRQPAEIAEILHHKLRECHLAHAPHCQNTRQQQTGFFPHA